MSITQKELQHIAKLSNLEFTDAQMEKFQTEFEGILNCVNEIQNFKSDKVYTDSRILNAETELRADKAKDSIPLSDIKLNAPEFKDSAIVVPAVAE